MAGGPSHPLNIQLRLTGIDDVKRELRRIRQEVGQFQRDLGIDFGYFQRATRGRPITGGQRQAALAELGYLRAAGMATFGERFQQAQGDPVQQALIRNQMQDFQRTLAQGAQGVRIVPGAQPGLFHPQGFAMNALRGLLGISAIGSVGYGLMSVLRRSMVGEYGRERDVANLMRRMAPEGMGIGAFTDFTRRGGERFGFTPGEQTQFRLGMGRVGGAAAMNASTQAMMMTRVFGLDPRQGAGIFGGLARMGITDETGQKRFAGYIAEAVMTGRLKGREGEVWESVMKATDAIQRYLGLSGAAAGAVGGNLAAITAAFAAPGITPALAGAGGMQAWMQAQSTIAGIPIFGLPPGALQGILGTVLGQATGFNPLAMYQMQQGFLTQGSPQAIAGRFTNIFSLAGQAGGGGQLGQLMQLLVSSSLGLGQLGPQMVQAMYSQVLPGTGRFAGPPTPGGGTRSIEKMIADFQKNQTAAQRVQELRAKLEEQLANAGQKLIPAFGDLLNALIILSPVALDAAQALADFDQWIKTFLADHPDFTKNVAKAAPAMAEWAFGGAAADVALGALGVVDLPMLPVMAAAAFGAYEAKANPKGVVGKAVGATEYEFEGLLWSLGLRDKPPPGMLENLERKYGGGTPTTTAPVSHRRMRPTAPTPPTTPASHPAAPGAAFFSGGIAERIEGTIYIVDSKGTHEGKFGGSIRRPLPQVSKDAVRTV